jgi:hypothetical protein
MTTELSLQSDVVRAVNDAGGFAFKMSHKFKVGVADLFVKLPGLAAAFFEVKYCEALKTLDYVTVEPTPLQSKFLRDAKEAGMEVGLISFVKGKNLGIAVFDDTGGPQKVPLNAYFHETPRHRHDLIVAVVRSYIKEGEDYGGL